MSFNKRFIIRLMLRSDFDLVKELLQCWNLCVHDVDYFYNTDQRGFFIAELDGEPIGCISAVAYNDSFGFIGSLFVKPEFRRKGFGTQLWKKALMHLGERNIGLDSVITQQETYKKYGFQSAYRNVWYKGVGGYKTPKNISSKSIVDLTEIPFADIIAYDTILFSVPRPRFLERWIHQPEGSALGYLSKGKLVGYGVIRACQKGFKIGPLFADEEQIAEELFNSLMEKVDGETIFLYVPEVNSAACAIAERHNLRRVSESFRMYTKKEQPYCLQLHRVFGVTSIALG